LIDHLIVGGGIAGASVAYFLAQSGAKVAIADDTGFAGAASLAAGAFINPVMGKPSKFKSFADEAFRFSVDFYSSRFPHLFNKCGSLIYPKNEKTLEEYEALGAFIPSDFEFRRDVPPLGAFFVKDSGIISPKAIIDAMLEGVKKINQKASKLQKIEGGWSIDGIEAKNVILAQGAQGLLVNEDYLYTQLYGLWGQKSKIKTEATVPYIISSKVHIVAIEGGLAIGATHIRSDEPLPINRADTLHLIEEAREALDIGDFEVIEESGGMRSASIDHFPLAGAVYDSVATLERFPSLIHGARLSSEAPSKYDGLYIHTGHGSRAFILSPYTAKLLADEILSGKQTPAAIDPARLLFRYFKKHHH
jgi:tRNA 5-methylaminomethyl-2-thiouridine biosynthesis bifunctional protein